MNLGDVMEEIGQRMALFDGVSVFDYPVDKPPSGHAVLLSIPQRIEYRGTYEGMTRYTLPLVVMVPRQDAKSMMRAIAEYASDSGDRSVKAHLESWSGSWQSCDEVTVMTGEFDAVDWAGVPYMAGLFTLDIVGSGA